jgi:hypothetical protein
VWQGLEKQFRFSACSIILLVVGWALLARFDVFRRRVYGVLAVAERVLRFGLWRNGCFLCVFLLKVFF